MNSIPRSIILYVAISLAVILVTAGAVTSLIRLNLISFNKEIRAGDLISAVSFIGAAVGLFLNWWQLRLGGIRKRAEFIVSVFSQFITDPDSSQAFYDIEYDELRYDGRFHGTKREKQLDRLLYYFEKIAALYDLGTISLQDLELVRYEFVRVYRNKSVQQYFETLDGLPELVGVAGGNYSRYRRVAKMLDQPAS